MQAIIMAAGKGSRLGDLTENVPKSFLEIKGFKLLEYNIALLHAYGIRDITIVTGYCSEMIEELVQKIGDIKCVYNPFYEMVNVLGSFYMAQEYLQEDTIYLHADTLCAPEIFEKMLQTDADIVLPVEFKTCDEEAMKVRTQNGRLVEISKEIPCSVGEGEFIGMAKLNKRVLPALKMATLDLMKKKAFNSYFEGAIQELITLAQYELRTIDVENHFWGEVDFLEDFRRVTEYLPENLYNIAVKEVR